jgi:O-antigen/teichoic acid export membrane protein
MFGTGLGQVLSFGFAPVLSRLYSPAEFGLFGSFFSIVGILSSVVTLRYSEAIMLPESDEAATRLFLVSCVAAGLSTLVFTLVCVGFAGSWVRLLHEPKLRAWIWLVPFAALAMALNEVLVTWYSRAKRFKWTAAAQVIRACIAGSTQTVAGLACLGPGGLIAGNIGGELAAAVGLWAVVGQGSRRLFRQQWDPPRLASTAREFKDFPLFTAPQYLANAFSQGVPVLILVSQYGAAVGGWYAFAARVIQAPMNLILISLRQVLFQKLSVVHNERGDLLKLFTRATGTLFLIVVPPAALVFLIAPWVFAVVFGSQWEKAGEYSRWLLFWLVPGFCNVPATLLGRILRKQKQMLVFDIAQLVARVGVLIWAAARFAPGGAVIAFSVVGGVFNLGLIVYFWRLLVRR